MLDIIYSCQFYSIGPWQRFLVDNIKDITDKVNWMCYLHLKFVRIKVTYDEDKTCVSKSWSFTSLLENCFIITTWYQWYRKWKLVTQGFAIMKKKYVIVNWNIRIQEYQSSARENRVKWDHKLCIVNIWSKNMWNEYFLWILQELCEIIRAWRATTTTRLKGLAIYAFWNPWFSLKTTVFTAQEGFGQR